MFTNTKGSCWVAVWSWVYHLSRLSVSVQSHLHSVRTVAASPWPAESLLALLWSDPGIPEDLEKETSGGRGCGPDARSGAAVRGDLGSGLYIRWDCLDTLTSWTECRTVCSEVTSGRVFHVKNVLFNRRLCGFLRLERNHLKWKIRYIF